MMLLNSMLNANATIEYAIAEYVYKKVTTTQRRYSKRTYLMTSINVVGEKKTPHYKTENVLIVLYALMPNA